MGRQRGRDRSLAVRPHQLQQGQVVDRPGAGRAPAGVEDPPGKGAVVQAKSPPPPGGEVGEVDGRVLGPLQAISGADELKIGPHRPVSGKHQMVAVVDHEAELGVEIGPAAPPGLAGGLGDDHPLARPGQLDRGAEPGQAGADDVMHSAAHPSSPRRRTSQASSPLPSLCRRRGGAQPCRSVRSRIRE